MTFDPGLLRFSQSATTQARSYGPGGQRYGDLGIVITKVPPAGMASSWLRSVVVSGPACHACTTLLRAAVGLEPRQDVEHDAGRDDQAVVVRACCLSASVTRLLTGSMPTTVPCRMSTP